MSPRHFATFRVYPAAVDSIGLTSMQWVGIGYEVTLAELV